MESDLPEPLAGVEPAEVSVEDIEESEVRDALESSKPLVRQRGVNVCNALAKADADAVRPFIDNLGAVLDRTNRPVTLKAISSLDSVARTDPAALEPVLADLAGVLDNDFVDAPLTAANVFGKVVVEHPELCAPYASVLIDAVQETEPDPNLNDYSDVTDDKLTQKTLQRHERSQRCRRMADRRVLINVIVAIAETEPDALVDSVPDLVALFDDVDPGITGGAIDALGELARPRPDAVAPVAKDIITCLDHDRIDIRVRAIRALGHLGADSAIPKLREIAENDGSEDVREVAAQTADFLDERK